jgi:hypothetical protein
MRRNRAAPTFRTARDDEPRARLLRDADRHEEARGMLADIYNGSPKVSTQPISEMRRRCSMS